MIHSPQANRYVQYFLLAVSVLLLIPFSFYHQPEEGLDNSWNIALHLAYKYDLQFGKDFVFTYGPLGILHSRHPISVPLFVYLIFDIYFLASVFFVLRDIFKKHFGYFIAAFTLVVIILTMYESREIWLFLLLLYHLFSFLKEPARKIHLIQAILFTILSFYWKISLGIVGIFILLAILIYSLIRRKVSLLYGVIALFMVVLSIWITAKLLNVDLSGYITNSLQLINDYNDAMFRPIDKSNYFFIGGALITIALFCCWAIYRGIQLLLKKQVPTGMDELFIYAVIGLCLFVFFKSGFVRGESHFHVFFKSTCAVVVFIYLLQTEKFNKKVAAGVCWLILIICLWMLNNVPGSDRPLSRMVTFSFLTDRFGEIKNYFSSLSNYKNASLASTQLEHSDNKLKRIVGNGTVDIIPSEISKIYFSGLHYNPRPVIQSYAAYNEYLDSLNYEKYMSSSAPDYILFSYGSVDQRFPFFDESKTKLAMMTRYRVVGELDGNLILKKGVNTIPKLIQENAEKSITTTFGVDIPVDQSKRIQYSKFVVSYSNWGKIRRMFFQPPELKITVTLDNGEARSFRVIKPIMQGGVIINKYVDSKEEFQFLLLSSGRINTRVTKIRIGPDSIHSGFNDSIKIISKYYSFSGKTRNEEKEDSLAIATLLEKFKPVKIPSTSLINDDISIGLQSFNVHSSTIQVEGWAFREKGDNREIKLNAILKFRDNVYELPTEQYARRDLPPHFKRDDIENCGFISKASKHLLPAGHYQLGIAVTDTKKNQTWVKFLPDNNLLIRGDNSLDKLTADPIESNTEDIQYYIPSVEKKDHQVIIDGWSFIKDVDSKETTTSLILKGEETFKINTDIIRRADVSIYFKNPLLDYSGFNVVIPEDALPPGNYLIGIEQTCCGGKKHVMKWSDSKFKIGED